jgi:hypothetical protein
LAKKQSTKTTETKSDVIRSILKQQPKASVKEIQSALAGRGVKASVALVNKIKYGRGHSGTRKAGRRSGAKGDRGSKARAIRAAWEKLGHHARPRDVIAELAARGVAVTSAQVSTLRKAVSSNGHSITAGVSVPFDHLLAAKALVARLGGIEPARHALANLAKFVGD